MAETDGLLTRHYEVHCKGCEAPALGLGPTIPQAEKVLRRDGWEKVAGRWHCHLCLPPVVHGRPIEGPGGGELSTPGQREFP